MQLDLTMPGASSASSSPSGFKKPVSFSWSGTGERIFDVKMSTKGDDWKGEEVKEQESNIPRIVQILRRPQASAPPLQESNHHPDLVMVKTDKTVELLNWGYIADQEDASNSVIKSALVPSAFDNLKRELTSLNASSSLSWCGIEELISGTTIGINEEGEKVKEPGSISPRTVQITPVPAAVDVKKADGDEEIIFSQPACLRKYDALTREWKKVNGNGDIKIVYHREKNTFRIVMRSDQVSLKLACGHCITPEMVLKPVSQSTKSWTWFVLNFSGNELVPEDFWVHFSQQDAADLFVQKFVECRRSTLQGVIPTSMLTEKEEEGHEEPASSAVLSPVLTD